MRALLVIGAIGLALSPAVQGQAYRCEDAGGNVTYSDEPCGENAEPIELKTGPSDQGKSESERQTNASGASGGDESSPEPGATGNSSAPNANSGQAQAANNPCLDTGNNDVMRGGTSESRIRAACGSPDDVTTDNKVFDKTLHYSSGERKMQIFIQDGRKVGHNAL